MVLLWREFVRAVPLIWQGNPYLLRVIGFTLEVCAVAVGVATAIGLPLALVIGLGRFRGVGVLRLIANVSLGVPPVVVGFVLFLAFSPQGPLGSLSLNATREGVLVAQTALALPLVVALSAAALRGLPEGLLQQARGLGAGRLSVARLALREARVGIVAAIVAALGTALAEVGAIVIVGANIYGYDQTLASSTLFDADAARYTSALAVAIVLGGLILLVMGGVSLLQHRRPVRRLA